MEDPKRDFQTLGYSVLPRFLDDELRTKLLRHVLVRAKDTAAMADDKQVPGTPAIYGDRVMERLLARLAPTVRPFSQPRFIVTVCAAFMSADNCCAGLPHALSSKPWRR